MDPFVPILVSNYSPKEFESCVQYYLENSWLQHEKGWFSSFLFTESPHVRALMSPTAAACMVFLPCSRLLSGLLDGKNGGGGWGAVTRRCVSSHDLTSV